jgi:hypothetical protein
MIKLGFTTKLQLKKINTMQNTKLIMQILLNDLRNE